MLGYIAYRSSFMPPLAVINGARFLAAYVVEGNSFHAKRSARAAARRLRREGVRRAVFPPDYPHRGIFAQYGVTSPPLAPLYRATAAKIALCFLAQRGIDARRATVAIAAQSATPELCRCVEALCAGVRYISLSVPRGGEALAARLRWKYGIAALDAAHRPDLALAFDNTPAEDGALCLDESLDVAYDSEYPNELLAALHLALALDTAALRVTSVTPTTGK